MSITAVTKLMCTLQPAVSAAKPWRTFLLHSLPVSDLQGVPASASYPAQQDQQAQVAQHADAALMQAQLAASHYAQQLGEPCTAGPVSERAQSACLLPRQTNLSAYSVHSTFLSCVYADCPQP